MEEISKTVSMCGKSGWLLICALRLEKHFLAEVFWRFVSIFLPLHRVIAEYWIPGPSIKLFKFQKLLSGEPLTRLQFEAG
jgi:hypothetical protein